MFCEKNIFYLFKFALFLICLGLAACSTTRTYNWPKEWDGDVEYKDCYFKDDQEAENFPKSFEIDFEFRSHRKCDMHGAKYCKTALDNYSQFLQQQDLSISSVEKMVNVGFCTNKCLEKYVDDNITDLEEQNDFLEIMAIMGRVTSDLNSMGDALIQSSGSRQRFAGLKKQEQEFSFPGFKSFIKGFSDIISNVNGAINIISQITKETEKYIDKVLELTSSEQNSNEKIGPIGMFNLEAAGRLMQDVVRSNTAYHKSINAGYFNHFSANHTMPLMYLPLCMDELTLSEKLYSLGFEKYSRLDAPAIQSYDIRQNFKIQNVASRLSTTILYKQSNTTICEDILPDDD